jgi:type IV secretory pathway TraG/TraD family ATPase VirD4
VNREGISMFYFFLASLKIKFMFLDLAHTKLDVFVVSKESLSELGSLMQRIFQMISKMIG